MTADAIEVVFYEFDRRAEEVHREVIRASDPYETNVWRGTIQEAWEREKWPELVREVNARREEKGLPPLVRADFEANRAEIEGAAKDIDGTVVGGGRPLVVALLDGECPAVFCEDASLGEVLDTAETFYYLL
jgi:hypothetical protein